MDVIVTWMYCSPPKEKIKHAQMGSNSDLISTQNYYWRCIFLLFESSHRHNKNTRHILLVNKMPPDTIDGIEISKLIKQYNIEIVDIPNITKAPSDYHNAWNIQFTLIDIMKWIGSNVAPNDHVYLLDSDVIFNKPISQEMTDMINKNKAIIYTRDYDLDHPVNGLSRRQLAQIANEMSHGNFSDDFSYAGGEILGCLGSELSRLASLSRENYNKSLERHANGQNKFLTEEHLFSYVYQLLGYVPNSANPFIKRIWTDRSLHCNVTGNEHDYIFWHLPAEKKRGFYKLFKSYKYVNGQYKLNTKNIGQVFSIDATLKTNLHTCFKKCARFIYKK